MNGWRVGCCTLYGALQPGCVLVVQPVNMLTRDGATAAPLIASTSAVKREADGLSYQVTLNHTDNAHAGGFVVLAHASWSLAAPMRWLLDHVRDRCAMAGPSP